MNMVCINADWGIQGRRRPVIEVRLEGPQVRPANRPIMNDPHQKIGSFADTAPEDRDELLDLLEQAFARL